MSKTTNFGLNSFGPEGRISDEGYKFSLRDRETIDKLLWTMFNHTHRAVDTTETLAGPKRVTTEVSTSGGTLPAATDFFYAVAWLDANLNETQVSVAVTARTPDPLPSPDAPLLTTATTGGSLEPGTYKYALAYYQGSSGFTRAPNISSVVVPEGTSTNIVTITLDTPAEGADGWRVYRKGPSDLEYWLLEAVIATATPPTSYIDDDSVTPDCTKARPTSNTTSSSNKVTITLSADDLPLDTRIASWRVYRTSAAGSYATSSLLATVTETTTEGGSDLVTTYDDTGGGLSVGTPVFQTTVPPAVPQLDISDVISASSGYLPATVAPQGIRAFNMLLPGTTSAKVYNKWYATEDMRIERLEIYWSGTNPSSLTGSDTITLRVKDDSLVDEVQSVSHDATTVDEVQRVSTDATSGTFTLSFSGQGPTGTIPYNATTAQVKAALELLSNITTVTVTGTGTAASPWNVEFNDPGAQNVAQMTANSTGLTGGTASVSTATQGNSGGTFTLTFDGQLSGAIAWDATATPLATPDGSSVEEKLEALSNITDVSVTGTGTTADPFLVTFVNPGDQDVVLLVAGDSLLNGSVTVAVVTDGRGNTQIDLVMDAATDYYFYQTPLTDEGSHEAEGGTGGTEVSDTRATNDVAMELDAQYETNDVQFGDLDGGEYTASFYVSDVDGTSTYTVTIEDRQTATPVELATATYSDGRLLYEAPRELAFTAPSSTNDIYAVVEKTDTGTDRVRVDRYDYATVLPTIFKSQFGTVELVDAGSPVHGSDPQVTIWY